MQYYIRPRPTARCKNAIISSLYIPKGVGPNSFRAGTDFRRQNRTSMDVRFRRLKSVPKLKEFTKI